MATSYTTLLGLALPVTGELSGTWGDTVNDYITQYLDAAIAGTQTISGSQTAVTLSKTTNASLGQAGSGATGSSQYQIINCTGNPASELTVTVPAASKAYLVLNNTSTNQSVKVVGAGPTTGVTVAAARCALIAWNGSDFELVASTDVAALQGLGTGVATALGVNVGTAGAFVVNGGALGTPSAGTVTNLTGTASININGTVGATTPTTGAFTTLTTSSTVTHNGGTANGVAYLNGSKVLTTGSALTFDGTTLTNTRNTTDGTSAALTLNNSGATGAYATLNLNAGSVTYQQFADAAGNAIGTAGVMFRTTSNHPLLWGINSSEQMRLTSTGLGIGTSSPAQKLHVVGATTQALFEGGVQGNIIIQKAGTSGFSINSDAAGKLSFYDNNSASTRLTLDSSGNLGLGVTPSAWGSGYTAQQIKQGALWSTGTQIQIGSNAFWDGSNYKYILGDFSSRLQQVSGEFRFFTAPSGTAGNTISFTQAMTLDASGRLGIGNTLPACSLDVFTTASEQARFVRDLGTDAGTSIQADNDGAILSTIGVHNLRFFTNSAERARIDSSGNLLVGTTSASSTNSNSIFFQGSVGFGGWQHADGTASGTGYAGFYYNGGAIGSITQNGTTAVAYNTSSDYRLKENIQPMTGALAKVAQLKPCTYKWKADGSDGEGFIAHELAEVCPDAVTGEKDAVDEEGNPVYQGIDTSFLVATLTAAIQELKAEFDAYKATHP